MTDDVFEVDVDSCSTSSTGWPPARRAARPRRPTSSAGSAGLHLTWQGEAADSTSSPRQTWDHGFRDMRAALQQMRGRGAHGARQLHVGGRHEPPTVGAGRMSRPPPTSVESVTDRVSTPVLADLVGGFVNEHVFQRYGDVPTAVDAFLAERRETAGRLPGEVARVLVAPAHRGGRRRAPRRARRRLRRRPGRRVGTAAGWSTCRQTRRGRSSPARSRSRAGARRPGRSPTAPSPSSTRT